MPQIFKYNRSYQLLITPWAGGDFFADPENHMFDPDSNSYDPANAWWLNEISRLVYHTDPDFRKQNLSRVGLIECDSISIGDLHCSLIKTDGNYWPEPFSVLVFRGSIGFRVWKSNFRFWRTRTEKIGSVHSGFWNLFSANIDKIDSMIEDNSNGKLFICGHSLGAALAMLTAATFNRDVQTVYGFGCPFVGNKSFIERLNSQSVVNIVNGLDIVCKVPFKIFGYYNYPNERIRFSPQRTRWRIWEMSCLTSDHSPINYTNSLAIEINNSGKHT